MLDKFRTERFSWILLIGIIMLLFEMSFYDGGVVFFLILAIGCIYAGRKRLPKSSGKVLFWSGIIGLSLTILNTMAFRFFLLALLVMVILKFAESKKNPNRVEPHLVQTLTDGEEPVYIKKSTFQNVWFGRQQTPGHVYEWNDINIQGGIGDTVIDLGNTVLPKGTSVISVRQILGNIVIMVPYDIEVSIHHNGLAGAVNIFESAEPRSFNQSIYYQSSEYDSAHQKVKIITALAVGDLEVRRV
ncbi:cell wall-active antibiotics response protein [Rossellomorea vietnamensis]|uniref:Cell wall-active antibiotics response protein n=1 Tax=Rossellomorea vietnamensis TaxID=218284 RepID=A0A5D4NL24_9BACI|nr:cell wall-active antibiotics response protein LiaF [Rossellomorea vietnamensis]TYS14983.1 cell wall-active antibiotics response protein [Rossellomorea vietnamensis]